MPAPNTQATAENADQRWIPVAHLLRPQGRRGELLADPLTDVAEVFVNGRHFRLAAGPETAAGARTVALESSWRPTAPTAARPAPNPPGTPPIPPPEALQTQHLFLAEADLPTLDQDTYLVGDLVGCTLYDHQHPLGAITGLQFPVGPDGRTRLHDAVDLLVLQPANAAPNTEPVLIPFVKAWLTAVDLPGKRITMHLPPGLMDDADASHEL